MPAQLVAIQARDSNGDPVSGAKFYTYAAGTSTPQAVYSDNALSTSVANPVVCDSYGRAAVWMDADLTYKFALKTSDDATNLIPTIDNYSPRVDDILYLISVDTATALTAAQDAQAAAEAAQAAAETAQTNAETAETGAETAETNAASSATAAASSATGAASSATAAAASATTASTAATNAGTAQTAAETAQTAAETAQTAAETAQGLAETAAAATEGSATAAATSATAASTSATAADASADEALARLAATTLAAVEAIGTVLGPKFVAKSATTLAEPGSPANGDTYILPASGTLTGTDWSGFTNGYVARYMTDGGWFEDQPAEGWRAYVQDSNIDYLHDGTNWKHDPGQITINAEEYGLTTATTEAARVTALQAAIDAAKVEISKQLVASANRADLVTASVLLPSGLFTFDDSIVVDMGVRLIGQGAGNTVLDFSTVAAAAGTAIKWGDAASSNQYFYTSVEHITILGDATLSALNRDGTSGSIGVEMGKVYRNCHLRHCAIWGFDIGLSGEAFGYEVENCWIVNHRSYCADVRNATSTAFKNTRFEYAGEACVRLQDGAGTQATGTLTLTSNAANNETVTIGSTVYTYKTTLTPTAYEVLIGASASDSLDNLIAAINAGAGSGTLYASGTSAHPDVTAAAGAGDTMDVTATRDDTSGNSIASTETMTNGSWANATLSGGVSGQEPIACRFVDCVFQNSQKNGFELVNGEVVTFINCFWEDNNNADNFHHALYIYGDINLPRVSLIGCFLTPTGGGESNYGDAINVAGNIFSLELINTWIRASGATDFTNGINFAGSCEVFLRPGTTFSISGTDITGLSNVTHYDYIDDSTTERTFGGRTIFERQAGNQQMTLIANGTNANSSLYITANGTGEANVLMGDESDADPGRLKYENSGDVMSIWSSNNRRVNFSGNTTDTTVAVHAPADTGNSILDFEDTSGVAFSIDMDHNNGRAQFKYAGTTTIRIDAAGTILMIGLPTGTSQVNAGAAANQLWVDTADQTIKLGT